jgi:hypothetical protein
MTHCHRPIPQRRTFAAIVWAGALGLSGGPVCAATNPTHQVVFPYTSGVQTAAFGPDGASVYCCAHTYPINVWAVIVHVWPEALGIVVGIVTVVCGIIILKAVRRPRREGISYCRKCNYDLTGQSGSTCPECGRDTANRGSVLGKTLLRRVALPAVVWFVFTAGYSVLWTCRIPRDNAASRWIEWPSKSLARWSDEHQVAWLQRLKSFGEDIVRVDLATGGTTLVRERLHSTYMNLTVTPDGRSLILADDGGPVLMDLATGHEHGAVTLPGGLVDIQGDQVLGYSRDGSAAYVQWFDEPRCVTGVSAWTLATGKLATLVETPAYTDPTASGGRGHWSRRFVRIGESDPPRFVSVPTFMEAFPTKSFEVRVHGAGSEIVNRYRVPGANPSALPVITPDGSKMFLSGQHGGAIGVEPSSGESLGALDLHGGIGEALSLDASGDLLCIPGSHSVILRDTVARAWAGEYALPGGTFAPRPRISSDGKWLMATCQLPVPPGQSVTNYYSHELVLWRLPDRVKQVQGGRPSTESH